MSNRTPSYHVLYFRADNSDNSLSTMPGQHP